MNIIAPAAHRARYEADEHAWLLRQIAALRDGRLHDLDRDSLAEYLADMGRRDERELRSRFVVLLQHLLKIAVQPERLTRSWNLTVLTQQQELLEFLRGSPSLAARRDDFVADAYGDAVRRAAAETELPPAAFPPVCPWTADAALAFVPPAPKVPVAYRRKRQ